MEQVRENKGIRITFIMLEILSLFSAMILVLKAFMVVPVWNIVFGGIPISYIFIGIIFFLDLCLWLVPKKKKVFIGVIVYGLVLSFCAAAITI